MKTQVSVETDTPKATLDTPLPFWNRFTSRKFWSMVGGVGLSWLCLERGVNHLYALPGNSVFVYGVMFCAVMTVIGCVVCKYYDIPTSFTGAGSFSGSISASGQSIAQHIDENRTERIETTEHVIDEGANGAPARRPFTPYAE